MLPFMEQRGGKETVGLQGEKPGDFLLLALLYLLNFELGIYRYLLS